MDGVHDLGGMHGFGRVAREENEPVFHAPWEGVVYAINRMAMGRGLYNIDEMRHGIERMAPAEYLASTYYERWLATIERNLVDKGVLTREEIQFQIDLQETRSPADGARLVARAWVDPAFKARLLADPKAATAELGVDASSIPELVVLENTDQVHHLVVCTLCSCYPRPILGRPPDWYKSFNYRSRAVVEPRAIMREFGYEPGPDVEIRVHDSTADVRYLVLPQRPVGSEGMSEAELARLVTRDSMIGVTAARTEAVPVA